MEIKDYDRNLGLNAKRLREAAGMSQETVAACLGLSRSTYKQYENSKRKFPTYLVGVISQFYGVRHPLDLFEDDVIASSYDLGKKLQILNQLNAEELQKNIIKFSEEELAKEEEITNSNIKYNLKKLRIKNNKNQQQVADRLDINLSTYSRYESGDVIIDNNKLGILSDWYNVPITDFYLDIE